MGIKDDIVQLVAHKKFMGQILSTAIIVYLADIRITSLYGLFQIYDISYTWSILFTFITIIGITNSFNLIDGIDSLAASIGSLASLIFGIWFYLTGHIQYSILSFAMLGSLIGFLYYNRSPARIFMGDTGSLVLGITISILAIKFIEFNKVFTGPLEYHITAVPAVTISILIIPIFDTCRVFTLRILQGKSPFNPDRNHLHHILTDLNYSHHKSTLILVLFNIFSFLFTFMNNKDISGELLLALNIFFALVFSFYYSNKRRVFKNLTKNKEHTIA